MIDETTADLLHQALEQQTSESLDRLTRHLQRSGYGTPRSPANVEEAYKVFGAVEEWWDGEGDKLVLRFRRLMGPLNEDISVSHWSGLDRHGSLKMEVLLHLERSWTKHGFEIIDRDATSVEDDQILNEIGAAARTFGLPTEPWLLWLTAETRSSL